MIDVDTFLAMTCPEPNTGCLLWCGATDRRGYGKLGRWIDGQRRTLIASRVSYELFVGPIAPGLHVLHSCDTPRCVEPKHLRQGTRLDNARDAVVRNRAVAGERHGAARLTDAQAEEIRLLVLDGFQQREVARHYGVSECSVSLLVRNFTYKRKKAA